MLLRSEANPTQIRDLRVSACAMVFVCSRPDGISILVTFKLFPTPFLPYSQSEHMARLVKVPGIVIQASGVRAKATRITIQCRSCRAYESNIAVKPGLEGYSLPRKCNTYVCV